MDVIIAAKDFDLTPSIEEMIHKKLSKIEKILHDPNVKVHWVCKKEGDDLVSDVHLVMKGHDFHTHVHDRNLYHTFDLAVEKLKEQIQSKLG